MSEQQLSRTQIIADKIANSPAHGPNWISGGALLGIVFLVTTDVILRATLNRPITGSYELSQLMMVFVAVCALGYTQVHRRFIAIPVLVMRFPQRVQSVLECSAWLLGCMWCGC